MSESHPPRVILLGASNLTSGLSSAVATAQAIIGTPVDLYIAAGHGRSYGVESRVLGRSLPGILDCGLWDAIRIRHPSLEGRRSAAVERGLGGGSRSTTLAQPSIARRSETSPTPLPKSGGPSEGGGTTRALITDIGNDIMYGFEPDQIAEWIDRCAERLNEAGARIVMTSLPMASINRLSPGRYAFVKSILFPERPLTHRRALDRAAALDSLLRELAQRREIRLVEPQADWYGFDPVHIRRSRITQAWAAVLAPWSDPARTFEPVSPSLVRWLRLRTAMPQRWRLLGVPLGRRQPCTRLAGGSRVHLF